MSDFHSSSIRPTSHLSIVPVSKVVHKWGVGNCCDWGPTRKVSTLLLQSLCGGWGSCTVKGSVRRNVYRVSSRSTTIDTQILFVGPSFRDCVDKETSLFILSVVTSGPGTVTPCLVLRMSGHERTRLHRWYGITRNRVE